MQTREHLFCVDITHTESVGKYGRQTPSNQKPWEHLQIEIIQKFRCKHKGIIVVAFGKVLHLKSMLNWALDY